MTGSSLPPGFRLGHWTDPDGRTGCTVILPPPGSRGSVDVRGGGTGTRELENLSPLANSEGPNAVLLTGGSAFGLAAADGVVRWLEERGHGRPTPGGAVPLVPSAVVFDLVEGSSAARPGPAEGYAACAAAQAEGWKLGAVGAGTGTAVGKLFGRDRASHGGVGVAARTLADGTSVAAIAVANAFGDVIGGDGELLGAPRDDRGQLVRTSGLLPGMPELPEFRRGSGAETGKTSVAVPASGVETGKTSVAVPASGAETGKTRAAVPASGVETGNTTLVCVCTDASVDKRTCAIVARMATAGVARAVDPTFTPIDGDVVFCVASGVEPPPPPGLAATWSIAVLGTAAATVTAEAIRDAVRRSN